ncbi:hypothetical protein BDP27DRAFT_1444958 [Rhodocollybia butyracea]|uniref:Uncharacterized protein n=1 Tax=Rhodocollybia butyracea TaxID=206335 RepID=A0A9P5Q4X4_9AGAR|nr:hypothetical protein BDP27DRAFT_1444958 [Rhodocollybia butyracea]
MAAEFWVFGSKSQSGPRWQQAHAHGSMYHIQASPLDSPLRGLPWVFHQHTAKADVCVTGHVKGTWGLGSGSIRIRPKRRLTKLTVPALYRQVTKMNIIVMSRLYENLSLIGASFANITKLDVELDISATISHIDDLVDGLACFPSLRILSLYNIFDYLYYFKHENPLKPLRETKSLDRSGSLAAEAELKIMWYASKIAKGTALEALYVYQRSFFAFEELSWSLYGWLEVSSSRNLIGALKISTPKSDNLEFCDGPCIY